MNIKHVQSEMTSWNNPTLALLLLKIKGKPKNLINILSLDVAPQENTWLVSNDEELKDNDKENENLASSSHIQENE